MSASSFLFLSFVTIHTNLKTLFFKIMQAKCKFAPYIGWRLEMPAKKDRIMRKEPWDSSSEKAATLKIEDFGIPDEVREMAKPIRYAENRPEATRILKEIANQGPAE